MRTGLVLALVLAGCGKKQAAPTTTKASGPSASGPTWQPESGLPPEWFEAPLGGVCGNPESPCGKTYEECEEIQAANFEYDCYDHAMHYVCEEGASPWPCNAFEVLYCRTSQYGTSCWQTQAKCDANGSGCAPY
jgi:hypothetical protein